MFFWLFSLSHQQMSLAKKKTSFFKRPRLCPLIHRIRHKENNFLNLSSNVCDKCVQNTDWSPAKFRSLSYLRQRNEETLLDHPNLSPGWWRVTHRTGNSGTEGQIDSANNIWGINRVFWICFENICDVISVRRSKVKAAVKLRKPPVQPRGFLLGSQPSVVGRRCTCYSQTGPTQTKCDHRTLLGMLVNPI